MPPETSNEDFFRKREGWLTARGDNKVKKKTKKRHQTNDQCKFTYAHSFGATEIPPLKARAERLRVGIGFSLVTAIRRLSSMRHAPLPMDTEHGTTPSYAEQKPKTNQDVHRLPLPQNFFFQVLCTTRLDALYSSHNITDTILFRTPPTKVRSPLISKRQLDRVLSFFRHVLHGWGDFSADKHSKQLLHPRNQRSTATRTWRRDACRRTDAAGGGDVGEASTRAKGARPRQHPSPGRIGRHVPVARHLDVSERP